VPPELDLDTLVERLATAVTERLGAAAARRYFSIAAAAAYTGLSADSIRGLITTDKLTAYRPVPGRVLVDRRELDSLIQASTKRPRRGRGIYHRSPEEGQNGQSVS
jgi:hypothetical protein